MATIVLRSVKGSPLTIAEADANFTNLNTEVGTKLTATDYNASDVLTKLKTVDGSGSGLDADLLDGLNTSSNDTSGDSVVTRSSGNFSAGTITASLVGNVTGNNVSSTTAMQLAVYANATVRDSSISSPTPGMMVYVTGVGMQVYGATQWNTISGTAT